MSASAYGRRTLGVGIIGSGLMAKAHTMAWRNLRAVYGQIPVEIRLVVLVDATDELAAAGAAQFGYERWTTSWQDVVEDPAVDIVDIVTPNFLHKEVAIAAARAGKHIWCEKPLALTADDALEMTKVAEDSGVKTLVGFSYLRNPGVVLAKKLVQDGEIGKPVSFTGTFAIDAMTDPGTPFTWRQDRALAGTGALGDLGAHIIAFARHLVGPIERVASLSTITVPRRPLRREPSATARKPKPTLRCERWKTTTRPFSWRASPTARSVRSRPPEYPQAAPTTSASRLRGRRAPSASTSRECSSCKCAWHPIQAGPLGSDIQLGPGHGDYGVLWPVPGINISVHDLKFFEAHDLIEAIMTGTAVSPDFREGWEVEKVIDAVDEASGTNGWVAIR